MIHRKLKKKALLIAINAVLMTSALTTLNAVNAAPGYQQGGSLPSGGSTVINATSFGVIANDGSDDAAALQAIIDSISLDNSPTNRIVIQLPAGEVELHDEVHVDRSGIIIQGTGSNPNNGTKIIVHSWQPYGAASDGAPEFDKKYWPGFGAFRAESRIKHPNEQNYEGSINYHWKHNIEIVQPASIGDTVLELENRGAEKFSVGDLIYVGAANDTAFLDLGHVPAGKRNNSHIRNGHMRTQIFKVAAVDTANNTVTIDQPLEFDISPVNDSNYKSRVMPVTAVEEIGFRDFYITMDKNSSNCAAFNDGVYNSSSNPQGARFQYQNLCPEDAIHGIIFKWAYNGWVDNVKLEMVGSHPIVTEFAKNMTFSNNMIDGSWNKGAGGNGYFRGSKLYDSWIVDNDIQNVRHLTLQWSATGNLVEQNTMNADINFHGGWERNNLIRNNTLIVPYEHQSWSNGQPGSGTWQPIWWASGDHASNWSGPTGPHNVLINNSFEKALSAGAPITPWGLFDAPNTEYIFGWNGTSYQHLSIDGNPVSTWTQTIAEGVAAQMPASGVTGPNTTIAAYNVGDTIEAEDYDQAIGNVSANDVVSSLNHGDTLVFENVRFDAITDITLTLAGTESGHHIELRKGSNTGLLLGTHITISTGDNTTFANAVVNLSTTATGIDDLVVTIAPGYGSNASAANIDSITLAALDPIVIDDEEEDDSSCQSYSGRDRAEIDLSNTSCITFDEPFDTKTLAFWDSDTNPSCNFRGTVNSDDGNSLTISGNYVSTTSFTGQTLQFTPSNGCQFIKIRAY